MVEISLSGSGGGHGRVASRGYPTAASAMSSVSEINAHVGAASTMSSGLAGICELPTPSITVTNAHASAMASTSCAC